MIFDQATTTLMHCFLLKASLLKKLDFSCCFNGICTAAKVIDQCSRTFFYYSSSFDCVHP
jgi:hypothetical protein